MLSAATSSDSFIETVLQGLPVGEPGKAWTVDAESHPTFLSVQPNGVNIPAQGWKLHLSATTKSARSCLEKALPVLISNQTHFKLAKSSQALRRLGESVPQVGKFLTIYPRDDDDAVRLAQLLHDATKGMRGPCIRTDRAFCQGSIVHYRYGSFKSRYLQSVTGKEIHAIETANGELVPDRRLGCYIPPAWAQDPFVSHGLIEPWENRPLFANRFLPVSLLQQGFQSDVFLGIDLENKSFCVIKRTRDDGTIEAPGGQGPIRLGREAELLKRMSHQPRIPRFIDYLRIQEDALLIVEWIDSVSLDLSIRERFAEINPLSLEEIVHSFTEIASAVADLHAAGFVHRDIKPANILVSKAGQPYLTDFDTAAEIAQPSVLGGLGTRGWACPQQFAGAPAAITDDIFGLGSTLLYMCTRIVAHEQPELLLDGAQVAAAFRQIRPDLPQELLATVLRCLAKDPECRFQSVAELQAAMSAVRERPVLPQRKTIAPPSATFVMADGDLPGLESVCRDLYSRMEEEVECVVAGARKPHLYWGDGSARISLELASGLSGILLVLAAMGEAFTTTGPKSIQRTAKLLVKLQKQRPEFLQPGLFTGKAGCALALAYAGSLLSDSELFAHANELAAELAAVSVTTADVYSGRSGHVLLYLALFKLTSDRRYLALAEGCGEQIIRKAEAGEPGLYWRNDNQESSKDKRYLGYLHGTAGIADVLLSLACASGNQEFRAAAAEAGIWLAAKALSAQDENFVLWPQAPGEKPAGPSLAQGSSGIGRFFLHAWREDLLPQARDLAWRAARSAATAHWLGPSLGHGLAGNIDFLLDAYHHFGEAWLLESARALGQSLLRSRNYQFSELRSLRPELTVGAPAYLAGYAGVLPVLLRLQDPERPSVFPVPM